MTTMAAWPIFRDGRHNAVYLASDSRITWGSRRRWDAGRKLFTCRQSADIFGYSGDVLFPSQVLAQIAELVDHGLLFNAESRSRKRHAAAVEAIQASHGRHHQAPDTPFEILHISRHRDGGEAEFSAWVLEYSGGGNWVDRSVSLEPFAPLLFGSGAARLAERIAKRLPCGGDDINSVVFSGFCRALDARSDARSGGAPQLVGLFSKDSGQVFGVIHEEQRFLHGLRSAPSMSRGCSGATRISGRSMAPVSSPRS